MTPVPRRPRPGRAELPLVQLLPNLVTLAAVAAGMTAIRMAVAGHFRTAVGLIILAALFDAIDGRLARLLASESAIGAELDSLADFLNFGAAPALILWFWSGGGGGDSSWIAFLIYAICCALRLARFNVGSRVAGEPPDKRYFTGVPAPAGAALAMLPLYLTFMLPGAAPLGDALTGLHIVAVGALMISRVPTWSFKGITIYADNARFVLALFAGLVVAVVVWPWATLSAGTLLYLATIPVSALTRRKPQEDAPHGD